MQEEKTLPSRVNGQQSALSGCTVVYGTETGNSKKIAVDFSNRLKKQGIQSKIKSLEDLIERNSKAKGYTVDLEFVEKSGPDVFEISTDFSQWPTSRNWASSPVTLSHELHHILGLGDRYDYIESHADNADLDMPIRLNLFLRQMSKSSNQRDDFSKMGHSKNPLLSEDICSVAFKKSSEIQKCITLRKDLDPVGIPPIK